MTIKRPIGIFLKAPKFFAMTYKIRQASYTDASQLSTVFCNAVNAFDRTHYTENQVQHWIDEYDQPAKWTDRLSTDRFIVAEGLEKGIVGFGSLKDDGRLDMLYVLPEEQHKGVATKLIDAIADAADDAMLPKLYTEASLASVVFFEKKGFQVQYANGKDYHGVHYTKIQLVKRLWLM